MKKFYLKYKDNKVVQQVVAQVSWGHNLLLISKIKDKNIRKINAEVNKKKLGKNNRCSN